MPDSLCYPRDSDSTYPFSPDHTRDFLEDKPFIEPFSLIPAMGAVTSRIRFMTFVLKLRCDIRCLSPSRPRRLRCSPTTASLSVSGPVRGPRTTTL